jgi:hypothetical protein
VGIFSFETTTARCAGLSFRVATFQRYTQQFHHLTKIVVNSSMTVVTSGAGTPGASEFTAGFNGVVHSLTCSVL